MAQFLLVSRTTMSAWGWQHTCCKASIEADSLTEAVAAFVAAADSGDSRLKALGWRVCQLAFRERRDDSPRSIVVADDGSLLVNNGLESFSLPAPTDAQRAKAARLMPVTKMPAWMFAPA